MVKASFRVASVAAAEHTATPEVRVRVVATLDEPGMTARAGLLRALVHIDAPKRRYAQPEQRALSELFGAPARWSRSLAPLLWVQAAVPLPAFERSCEFDLALPATCDVDVALSKYFAALEVTAADIPVRVMWSGTIFYETEEGALQVGLVPWAHETTFEVPVSTVRAALEHHAGGDALMRLPAALLDRLAELRRERGLSTSAEALAALLDERADAPSGPRLARAGVTSVTSGANASGWGQR